MSAARHKKYVERANFQTIRALIREELYLLDRFDRHDSELSIKEDDRPRPRLSQGPQLSVEASLKPMSMQGVDYYSFKFPHSDDKLPLFLIEIRHDFTWADIEGELKIDSILNDDVIKFSIETASYTPLLVKKMLTLPEIKNSSIKLIGQGTTSDVVGIDAVLELSDYIDMSSIDTSKPGFFVQIKLSHTKSFSINPTKDDKSWITQSMYPDGSYAVPAHLVLDNPGQYGLSLGSSTASRYSKEPYLRYCDPPEVDPTCNPMRPHFGLDLTRRIDNPGASIIAPLDGVVTQMPDSGTAGNVILMKHDDGSHTKYLHLQGYSKDVGSGSRAKAGQIIGYLGDTGRSSGPHLHFETYPPGANPVDPTTSVDPGVWLRDNDALFPITSNVNKM
jgi:murein DD-endopeptidase MepM/ murein hydrolase activator NlpD